MKKLNNKGFAISTMLYGLLIIMIVVMSTIMATMSFTRTNSKKFVNTTTRELEEGIGLKLSNKYLEIDSIDNKIYKDEIYNFKYTFRINQELDFVSGKEGLFIYGAANVVIGGVSNKINSNELQMEKKDGYTVFTITKDIGVTKDSIVDTTKGVTIELSKDLFSSEIPVDSHIIVPVTELGVVDGTADANNISIKAKGGCNQKAEIEIKFNKNGKIINSADMKYKINYHIGGDNNEQEVSKENYEVNKFASDNNEYEILIKIPSTQWNSSQFTMGYYPIYLTLKNHEKTYVNYKKVLEVYKSIVYNTICFDSKS